MKLLGKKCPAFNDIKSASLLRSIDVVSRTVSEFIWTNKLPEKVVTDFTDHGIDHSIKIIQILNTIITSNNIHFKLNETELYLLVICAYLHDIGLQCDPRNHEGVYKYLKDNDPSIEIEIQLNEKGDLTRETQKQIRTYHHKVAVSWIEFAYIDPLDKLNRALITINKEHLSDITQICKYHSKLPLLSLPSSGNADINLPRLILLFRVADELDIGPDRIIDDVLSSYVFPEFNAMHWYINQISVCNITNINRITLTLKISKNDYTAHYYTFKKIIDRFEEKNKELMERLREENVMISFSHLGSKVEIDNLAKDLPDAIIDAIYLDIEKLPYITNNYGNLPKKSSISCYISYCTDDIEDHDINSITNALETLSAGVIEVSYFKLLKNRSLAEILNDSECIIILATKGYLKSINNQTGSCYQEYSLIINRYKEDAKIDEALHYDIANLNYTINTMGSIQPKHVYFLIKYENDVSTNPIKKPKMIPYDLSEFKAIKVNVNSRNPKFELPPGLFNKHRHIFNSIIMETLGRVELEGDRYKHIRKIMHRNFLLNTKSDLMEFPESILVRTKSLQKISDGRSCFVIGRKGSGKSTVISLFSNFDQRKYKGIIKINVDKIDLRTTFKEWYQYNNQLTNAEISLKKDIDTIFVLDKTFEVIWDVFLYISCIHKVYEEYIRGELFSEQLEAMEAMKDDLLRLFPYIEESYYKDMTATLYTFAKNSVFEYLDLNIKNLFEIDDITYPTLISSLVSKLEIEETLQQILSENIVLNFTKIVTRCKRRIMITMDNFDTNYGNMRWDSIEDRKNYAKFENQWLRAFLERIFEIRTRRIVGFFSELTRITDFIVCIPHDRYVEFLNDNRDAYKYNNNAVDLRWSGIELAELLRKRLEFLYQDLCNSESYKNLTGPSEEKLLWLLQNKFPYLPDTISVHNRCTEKNSEIPLFQYVLRMSFWRPRDILTHYANIISMIESCREDTIESDDLKLLIKRTIIENANAMIIRPEFIGEFKSVIYNINSVVKAFRQQNQVLTWEELYKILNPIDIQMNSGNVTLIIEKIKILYEIGFLGIFPSNNYRESYAILHNNAFVFNEGRFLLTGTSSDEFFNCKFIIHPIFNEVLNLCPNHEEIICNYDWIYLHKNDKQNP